MQSRRIFPRIVTCLSLSLLCPALLSGCLGGDDDEIAEDYEINEIYMELNVNGIKMPFYEARTLGTPDESEKRDNSTVGYAKLRLYALNKKGEEIILRAKHMDSVNIRYAGKTCEIIEIRTSGKLSSNEFLYYECEFPRADISVNAPIEAEYVRPDGTQLTASVRWPGFISDVNVQEIIEPMTFLRTSDMHVSWTLPAEGQPDAVVVALYDKSWNSLYTYFEESVSGASESFTVPLNTLEDNLPYVHSIQSRLDMSLEVTSRAEGTVSPLLAGGAATADRTIYREIRTYTCDADHFDAEREECRQEQ